MLHFDLANEGETIRNYRERIRQCERLSASTRRAVYLSIREARIVRGKLNVDRREFRRLGEYACMD